MAGHGKGSQVPASGAVDLSAMKASLPPTEIVFIGKELPAGGFTARAQGQSIFTEANTIDELRANIRDAVACHYADGHQPQVIRLRIVTEEVLRPDE